jgi:hypothetical protein
VSDNFRGNLFRLCETGGGSGAFDPVNPHRIEGINKKARGEHRVPFFDPRYLLPQANHDFSASLLALFTLDRAHAVVADHGMVLRGMP